MIMDKKTFLITVDTEGDNLWNWHEGQTITTHNAAFIPRFQELCEKYCFIPTYFTNYEMANNTEWVEYAREKNRDQKCEIGLHIHAWNSPPIFTLKNIYGGNSYITEYPETIVRDKVQSLAMFLRDKFDATITSARSGRWATNDTYFDALVKSGIYVDCSITPGINNSSLPGCSVPGGNDYRGEKNKPSEIYPGLLEIPMTTRVIRWNSQGTLKHRLKSLLIGDAMWLRPIKLSREYLDILTKKIIKENGMDYLEFMIHSSELMPGCNPYYQTANDIKKMYEIIEWYFDYVQCLGYSGLSVTDYAKNIRGTCYGNN